MPNEEELDKNLLDDAGFKEEEMKRKVPQPVSLTLEMKALTTKSECLLQGKICRARLVMVWYA
jgi:hypothetical protein